MPAFDSSVAASAYSAAVAAQSAAMATAGSGDVNPAEASSIGSRLGINPLSFASMASTAPAQSPTGTASGWVTLSPAQATNGLASVTSVVLENGATQTLGLPQGANPNANAPAINGASGGLSDGAKLGIGLGVGLGGAALIGLFIGAFIVRKRRATRKSFEERTAGLRAMTEGPQRV